MITEEYREQNRQLHENPANGISGAKWAGLVKATYDEHGCTSALDYGCGKQTLGQALPHMMIRGYDPCIEGLDEMPVPADLVICGDVMEHVEEGHVDAVLDHLQELAKKVVILVISTRLAKKTLPDGRNAHITIHDGNWWLYRMMKRWDISVYYVDGGKEIVCLARPVVREVVQ